MKVLPIFLLVLALAVSVTGGLLAADGGAHWGPLIGLGLGIAYLAGREDA